MIRSVALIVHIAVLSLPSVAASEQFTDAHLRAFDAQYSIRKAGVTVGTVSRALTIEDNGRYEFSSTAEPSGIAALFSANETEETSVGHVSDSKIRPLQYRYQRKKGEKVKVDRLDFDLSTQTLSVNRRGINSQRPLRVGGLDKLSYQLQLMMDLLNGSNKLSYTVETATKTKTYDAKKTHNEEISTPAGKYLTIRIDESSSVDKRTSFWCSEELGFLPVKVVVTEDGDATEIVLNDFQYKR